MNFSRILCHVGVLAFVGCSLGPSYYLAEQLRPPSPPPDTDLHIAVDSGPFSDLPFWEETDTRPAFSAFLGSCQLWAEAPPTAWLHPDFSAYGKFEDMQAACRRARTVNSEQESQTRVFFEDEFIPASFDRHQGLLTGYYQSEIDVRRTKDAEFSEPILTTPKRMAYRILPRSQINQSHARVIAYGRPMDVFFMQIQGSGHIRFKNGYQSRAAFDSHNTHAYRSIGRFLIDQGELPSTSGSRSAIEKWIRAAGPAKAREVFNHNPRYIFFKEEPIQPDKGPLGGMRVPLEPMGSVAVDVRYHPYGMVAFINVSVPQYEGDYRGQKQGLLVVAQDRGGAIKGPLRGDIYFGTGAYAGGRAGVMKHFGQWWVLLPRSAVEKYGES